MRTFQIPSTLRKTAASGDTWLVGGVASSFHRDLDGEAITPEAVRSAIPGFMANRGADGVQGGPLRLHHNFWDRFLKQAIQSLRLPAEDQMGLISAIALPLGRVTKIWVDEDGKTHWRGLLSKANPISKVIWGMLQERMISLGVSLGGKIFSTLPNGRDAMGRPCTLIDSIRIDELSITDNPALRLTEGEDTGAYISALAKSVSYSLRGSQQMSVERFLQKALGSTYGAKLSTTPGNRLVDATTTTGMGRSLGEPKTVSPKGGRAVKMDGDQPKTGMGGKSKMSRVPKGSGNMPKVDQGGYTVAGFCRDLSKACSMCKSSPGKLKDPEMNKELCKMLTDGSYGLAGLTDTPPDELVNFVRFLQYISRFVQELPHMSDYQAGGTISAIGDDLKKALEEFEEKMPSDLMGKPLRPEGSPSVGSQNIVFPSQYVIYS